MRKFCHLLTSYIYMPVKSTDFLQIEAFHGRMQGWFGGAQLPATYHGRCEFQEYSHFLPAYDGLLIRVCIRSFYNINFRAFGPKTAANRDVCCASSVLHI